jgi:hypothetical protein
MRTFMGDRRLELQAILSRILVRFRRAGEQRGPEALLGHDASALEAPHRLQNVVTQLGFTTIGVVGCDDRREQIAALAGAV